jgi:hypothetical protein
MELNDNAKGTYIQLLIDSLKKKHEVLDELMQITTKQQAIIDSESFMEDEFLETISLKEEHIKDLGQLDRGFELVYERIREELNENRKEYIPQITTLKELVTIVTDLSVKLQALERSNKAKLEALLVNKRRKIRNSRLSNETVANYYKNMSGKTQPQSYFYDKKK